MIDVTLVVSSPQDNVAPSQEMKRFLVMSNGENIEFADCPNKILEIPEDYYFDIDIRYLFDDGSEIYNSSRQITISDDNHSVPHVGRPYYGLAGRHQIKISVFNNTDEFSEYRLFIEVLATSNSAKEIGCMLKAIDDDYNQIDTMCINNNLATGSSFIDLLDEAESIYNSIYSIWNRLIIQLRKSFAPKLVIKPNGVPNSPEAIHWICANP